MTIAPEGKPAPQVINIMAALKESASRTLARPLASIAQLRRSSAWNFRTLAVAQHTKTKRFKAAPRRPSDQGIPKRRW